MIFQKKEWLGNVKNDLLSGTVVALSLIPSSIAFSIIAGVDPKVGIYSSFCIAVIVAVFGGRPGMISASTGALSLAMVDLVKQYGLDYLLATTILTGIIQFVAAILKVDLILRFVSRSVISGFLNALAILIFMSQMAQLESEGVTSYIIVLLGLAIIYFFPRVTKLVPSSLVAIIVLTALSVILELDVKTVGDMGQLPDSFPKFFIPNIDLTLENFQIILPYAISWALIGLLESLLTAIVVDDFTDTDSNKRLESAGQGMANIVAGFFGSMAGCAIIGQSVMNVKAGGRGRLSCLWAGVFLLIMSLVFDDLVNKIPIAILVSVMVMVCIGTFNWNSIFNLKRIDKSSTIVMFTTVIVVILTHNLAKGVGVGVLLSALFFAYKVSFVMQMTTKLSEDCVDRVYTIYGQVFFVSAHKFIGFFDFKEVLKTVTIDLQYAHFWDITAIEALDKVIMKFRRDGVKVQVLHLNKESVDLVTKLGFTERLASDKIS